MFFNFKSPSPSVLRTPSVISTDFTTTPARLSKEKIDEIIDSPFETNYTYSDSIAYKPHFGSNDYVHPRLCRRYPRHWSSFSSRSSVRSWPNFFGSQNCNKCRCKWLFCSLFLLLLLFYFFNGSQCHRRSKELESFEQIDGKSKSDGQSKPADSFALSSPVSVPSNCSCLCLSSLVSVSSHFVSHRHLLSKDPKEDEFAKTENPVANGRLEINGTQRTNGNGEKDILQLQLQQLAVIDAVAFRERFVLQFVVVDYFLFNGFRFWNFSMSFSFFHL
ncbi:hypothetical protein niasHT_003771 [Heterodera trifolii]|uniref:Uncharacterized protein n=1 Tax=Heterodera trifolii TaxID=157864 RepID=A0ABD2LUR1_9BILA